MTTIDDSMSAVAERVKPLRRASDAATAASNSGSSPLERTLLATSSVVSARVATLKKALAEGRYQVDAEILAERMAQFEQQTGGE